MKKRTTLATLLISAAVAVATVPAYAKDVTTIKLSKKIHADGMVMNAEGDLLVSSAWQGRTIARVDLPSGNVSTYAEGLKGPISLAINSAGDVFSSNWQGLAVSRVTPDGAVSEWANVGPKGDGLAFDSEGDLWFTAGSSNQVKRISSDGMVTVVAEGGLLKYPLGIAISEADEVFVGGGQTGEIYKISSSGDVELFAKVPGPGPWRIGHLLYADGRLFASGLNSNKIFEISKDGTVKTLAGSGEAGNTDGDVQAATFSFPVSLQLSADKKSLLVFSGGGATDLLRKIEL